MNKVKVLSKNKKLEFLEQLIRMELKNLRNSKESEKNIDLVEISELCLYQSCLNLSTTQDSPALFKYIFINS